MRKLLSLFMIALLMTCLVQPVYSAGIIPEGTASEIVERMNEIINNPSVARIKKESERFLSPGIRPKATYWTGTTYGLNYYGQEASTTCGAACIRMAYYSVSGSCPYNERAVVEGIREHGGVPAGGGGLLLPGMADYINSIQTVNDYIDEYNQPRNFFQADIGRGIENHGAMPVVGVQEFEGSSWRYPELNAHFIVVYEVRSDWAWVRIADPYAGYVNEANNQTSEMSMDDLYTAYSTINSGYMW